MGPILHQTSNYLKNATAYRWSTADVKIKSKYIL